MATNVASDTSTATAKKSSRNPMASHRPMIGMWKSRWKRQPNASMMVRIRIVKPHMVKKWAVPGHRPLQELLLAGDLDQLGLDPLRDVLGPAGHGGLPGGDEPSQPEEPSPRDGEHHEDDHEPDGDSDGHCGSS